MGRLFFQDKVLIGINGDYILNFYKYYFRDRVTYVNLVSHSLIVLGAYFFYLNRIWTLQRSSFVYRRQYGRIQSGSQRFSSGFFFHLIVLEDLQGRRCLQNLAVANEYPRTWAFMMRFPYQAIHAERFRSGGKERIQNDQCKTEPASSSPWRWYSYVCISTAWSFILGYSIYPIAMRP